MGLPQLAAEDIVAIRHVHSAYPIPYFLSVVREAPNSTRPDERLRVSWLEKPALHTDGGYAYPLEHLKKLWTDECAPPFFVFVFVPPPLAPLPPP